MPRPPIELQTDRLLLRPLSDVDVAALVRHWGDAEVRRYLWDDKPVTLDMVNEVVTTSNRDFSRDRYGIWAVHVGRNAELIGMCGLRRVKGRDVVEILYSLRPRYWKKGYATEAARAVVQYAFEVLGLQEVVAAYDTGNRASASVLRRIGMVPLDEASQRDQELHYWHVRPEGFRRESLLPGSR